MDGSDSDIPARHNINIGMTAFEACGVTWNFITERAFALGIRKAREDKNDVIILYVFYRRPDRISKQVYSSAFEFSYKNSLRISLLPSACYTLLHVITLVI
jgi:hypothetical protein